MPETPEDKLDEILKLLKVLEGLANASHQRICDVDVKLRNLCNTCYYKHTVQNSDIPMTVTGESVTVPDTPPEEENKCCGAKLGQNCCGPVVTDLGSQPEKIYSRSSKKISKKKHRG